MNKEELKTYLEQNYSKEIEESKQWIEEFEKDFEASTNPTKSWAKACASYMKGEALGIYFAAREILTGNYYDQEVLPKMGEQLGNFNIFKEFAVSIQYRCIALHNKAQKELNNINMPDVMEQMAELFIHDGFGNEMEIGKEPHYVENGVVIKELKIAER